jgi:hypothetical protein
MEETLLARGRWERDVRDALNKRFGPRVLIQRAPGSSGLAGDLLLAFNAWRPEATSGTSRPVLWTVVAEVKSTRKTLANGAATVTSSNHNDLYEDWADLQRLSARGYPICFITRQIGRGLPDGVPRRAVHPVLHSTTPGPLHQTEGIPLSDWNPFSHLVHEKLIPDTPEATPQ